MARKIEFVLNPEYKDYDIPHPVPASHEIPEWFKDMGTEMGGGRAGCPVFDNDSFNPKRTVKACVPFLDGLTSGYIILLPVDVHVTKAETSSVDEGGHAGPKFRWTGLTAMGTHGSGQVPGMPTKCKFFQGKWINPWIIRTPPGYSCIFKHPEGRTHKYPFRQHMAIVDTDTYFNQVNGTFDWMDDDWEGIIPAGTPIMHVIPFKRDDWKMEAREMNKKDLKDQRSTLFRLKRRIMDGYKKEFWAGPRRFK